MKKLILITMAIMMLAGAALAGDVQLAGKTFVTTINDELYTLEFVQGPFGPGESGTATLAGAGITSFELDYRFENPFCTFTTDDGTIRYVFAVGEFVYAPTGGLDFKQVTE